MAIDDRRIVVVLFNLRPPEFRRVSNHHLPQVVFRHPLQTGKFDANRLYERS
jgi:hypothetical protein